MASLIGVNADTYRKWESGNANSEKRIAEIAEQLCVSIDFLLYGPIDSIPAASLSYRRKVALKSREARHIQGMASLATELVALIEEFVSLPAVSVPHVPLDSAEHIEDVVRDLRNHFQMSDAPLRNAMDLVEALGVVTFWLEAEREFDGVSFWHKGRPYILLNKNQKDGYRARFTLLHELGHLICHKSDHDAERHEDERKRVDREADLFASAFLMPSSSFARRFPRHGTLYDILDDRSYWKVSCAAMVRRAYQTGLIDEEKYRRLNVSISAKGWRRSEPNSPLPERSRVHGFFLDEAGEYGLTTDRLADRLNCPIGWFREAFPEAEQYQLTLDMTTFD